VPQAVKDAASGLQAHYFMDLASGFPPLALAPVPGTRVLDLCAGGAAAAAIRNPGAGPVLVRVGLLCCC